MALPRPDRLEPPSDAALIRAAVATFGQELRPRMRGDGREEDKLRAPVYSLLRKVGEILGRNVIVHDEVTVSEISSRPDFAVDGRSGRVGYVELKALRKGIPENWRPTKHDKDQWNNLRDLPNLIYTNGAQWALYRMGELVGRVATLDGDLAKSGKKLEPADDQFEQLCRDFLGWAPARPNTLQGIVQEVAPLCRLLRAQVTEAMRYEVTRSGKRPFATLANEWRSILFPDLTDDKFTDAYAQAVTFALLLARVDGIDFENRSLIDIAEQLSKQHSLMGEALAILTNARWVEQLSVVDMLRRVVGNIDWDKLDLEESDGYARLYESFLAAYDKRLRRESGTYYTPDPVARSMIQFVDSVLKEKLHKPRGFASQDVIVVDPAMGTGTFLVEVIDSVVSTLRDERGTSSVPKAHIRELFSKRLVGFELQVAPFAIAEMRLHSALRNKYRVELPREEARFLSNALDDPDALPLELGQLYDVLKETREGANRVKRRQPVMVVIGNPPWRERAGGEASWIEEPRDPKLIADRSVRPSLDDFRSPLQRRRAFKLSNMWTFFWRWATWKVFDSSPAEPAGVVALISPGAYVVGDAYAGMRRYLRETTDEGWIIDVTPEGFQPNVPTRLFPKVQQVISIGVFARYGQPDRSTPACIHHTSVEGTQEEKFRQLLALRPQSEVWENTPDDWEAPFKATSPGWASYPKLSDLFPWHQPGVKPNRNWVYAPNEETLQRRWSMLIHASREDKAAYFKETRDRKLDSSYPHTPGVPSGTQPLGSELGPPLSIVPVAFRSFDRQFLIFDRRVIDFPKGPLWTTCGDAQIYITEPPAYSFETGPGLTFSALVPDNDHFMGHHGGRVRPLYRDREGTEPNVTPHLLAYLEDVYLTSVTAADLLAYVAGVTTHSGFANRYCRELSAPDVRVPLTTDVHLWQEAVSVGREIVWLHTYGERYVDATAGRPRGIPLLPEEQRPRYLQPVCETDGFLPERIAYDADSQTLIIGEDTLLEKAGRVAPVSPAVWRYSVGGGVPSVRKWFGYRQRRPRSRRRTSDLDMINPTRWTAQFDDDLLALLNVLGRCVKMEPRQATLLNRICEETTLAASDLERGGVLPVLPRNRKPPKLYQDRLDGGSSGL